MNYKHILYPSSQNSDMTLNFQYKYSLWLMNYIKQDSFGGFAPKYLGFLNVFKISISKEEYLKWNRRPLYFSNENHIKTLETLKSFFWFEEWLFYFVLQKECHSYYIETEKRPGASHARISIIFTKILNWLQNISAFQLKGSIYSKVPLWTFPKHKKILENDSGQGTFLKQDISYFLNYSMRV